MPRGIAADEGEKGKRLDRTTGLEKQMSRDGQQKERHELGRRSIELTDHDCREAARLFALISNAPPRGVEHLLTLATETRAPHDADAILARVRKYMSNQRLRVEYFNRSIFGEPAWEILLVLYMSEHAGRRQTIRRLADRVNTPLTTASRWIRYLEREHLVAKEPHPTDRRMSYVTLLDKGQALIENYFSSINT